MTVAKEVVENIVITFSVYLCARNLKNVTDRFEPNHVDDRPRKYFETDPAMDLDP